MAIIERSHFRIKLYCLLIAITGFFFIADGKQKESHAVTTVVIDPGHGGRDPGSIVGKAREKNIVLDISLKLGRLIKNNLKNVKVVYTRDGDYFITLTERAQIANKVNADLFISIHANYCETPSVFGTETYVLGLHRTEDNLNVAKKENSVILLEDDYSKRYEGFNPRLSESYIMFELIQDRHLDQSLRFASILQSNFKSKAQRNDRDVRQAGFLVLRETAMPSVLIETGYLSNKKENSFLLTDQGRTEISESIYESVAKYLNRIEAIAQIPDPMVGEVAKTDRKPGSDTIPSAPTNNDTANKTAKFRTPEIAPVTLENQKKSNDKPTDIQANENKTLYAVQIGLFSKRIDQNSKVFEGLRPVKEITRNGKYKYFCFENDSFEKTKANFHTVTRRFPDAFIVSIKDGQVKYYWSGPAKK